MDKLNLSALVVVLVAVLFVGESLVAGNLSSMFLHYFRDAFSHFHWFVVVSLPKRSRTYLLYYVLLIVLLNTWCDKCSTDIPIKSVKLYPYLSCDLLPSYV